MDYTIDTNIISAFMRKDKGVNKRLRDIRLNGRRVFITAVSYYEIKRGLLATNAVRKLKEFEKICKGLTVIYPKDKAVFDKASEIYADLKQRGQLIGDADILIASIAITQNLILVSDNTDHFRRVSGITLENWLR